MRAKSSFSRKSLITWWSAVRRSVCIVALGLGGILTALIVFGHVGSSLIGTRLGAGESYRWGDGTIYVKSLAGPQECTVNEAVNPDRRVTLGTYFVKGQRFEGSHEKLKPDGVFLQGRIAGEKQIVCENDVRIGNGWYVTLYRVAQGGLWVVVPAAGALVLGTALWRKKPARRG